MHAGARGGNLEEGGNHEGRVDFTLMEGEVCTFGRDSDFTVTAAVMAL